MVGIESAREQARSVHRASERDAPAMARVLARAFHEDPAFSWVLHGDPRRMRVLERGFELFLRRVWLEQQETYTTAGTVAVSTWELPDQWKAPIGQQLLLLPAMAGAFKRHLPRVLKALTVLEGKHPREPHYYLAFIGVDPGWQSRGLGGAVLTPVLERCDAEGMPAFLEASTPRNRALYERHGFAVMEEFTLGRGAPAQWAACGGSRMFRAWQKP